MCVSLEMHLLESSTYFHTFLTDFYITSIIQKKTFIESLLVNFNTEARPLLNENIVHLFMARFVYGDQMELTFRC